MIPWDGDWRLRQATGEDVAAVREILIEAATWLEGRGIHQWRPADFTAARIAPHIAEHAVFLAHVDGVAAGTFRLQTSDGLIWPEASPGEALYLHSLATRRGYPGLGAALLRFAMDETRRRGHGLLRLDCWAGNESLVRYYTDQGFCPAGVVAEADWSVQRFEKAGLGRGPG